MNRRNQRVYLIMHKRDRVSGKTRVLLGKERFVHLKALQEMQTKLGAKNHSAERQRTMLRSLLRGKQPFLNDKGQCKVYGPWAGGNFGGVLLIGRTALPGGRVEASDESVEAALVRELSEEYQIHHESVWGHSFKKTKQALKPLIQVQRGRVLEHYYTLDVEDLRAGREGDAQDLRESRALHNALDLETVELNFDEGDASCEKRSLIICDEEELVAHFGDELREDDEKLMVVALEDLARKLCRQVLGMNNETECEAHVVSELLRFQRSRNMRTAKQACEAFIQRNGGQ